MNLEKYKLEHFCLFDDAFFRACFEDHPECTAELLKIILGIKDITIVRHQLQKAIGNDPLHGVILDVYAVNEEDKTIYDIEIQKTDAPNLIRRSRYYSSVIDARTTIGKNEDYNSIPDSYVIFICKDDIMREGRSVYHYTRKSKDNIELGDGSHILFVNGSYEGDDDIGKLMNDLLQQDVSKINNGILARRAAEIKAAEGDDNMVVTYFDKVLMEEKEEAKTEAALDTARRMLTKGKYSLDEIADVTTLPIEKVKELADSMTA